MAAEVLADDDVGGELAPGRRDLDVLLLEDVDALLVADAGGPGLPLDLVVGMDPWAGPAARESEAFTPMPVKRPSGSMGAPVSSHHGDAGVGSTHLLHLLPASRVRSVRCPWRMPPAWQSPWA